MNLSELARDLRAKHAAAQDDVRRARDGLAEAQDALAVARGAQEVLQLVAQAVQQQAHDQIAGVVSSCLAAVFDDPYTFHIAFDRKRGKTEARAVFRREGHEVSPTEAAGGGVLDVAAFALRLACLSLATPKRRPVLFLDEPFRCLDAQAKYRVRALLEKVTDDLGFQVVMVTHDETFKVGKVIELG